MSDKKLIHPAKLSNEELLEEILELLKAHFKGEKRSARYSKLNQELNRRGREVRK